MLDLHERQLLRNSSLVRSRSIICSKLLPQNFARFRVGVCHPGFTQAGPIFVVVAVYIEEEMPAVLDCLLEVGCRAGDEVHLVVRHVLR